MNEKDNKKKIKNGVLFGILIGLLVCGIAYAGITAYIRNSDEVEVSGVDTKNDLGETEEDTDDPVVSVVTDSEEVIVEKFANEDAASSIEVKAAGNEAVSESKSNPNSANASIITLIDGGVRYTQIVYPAGDYSAQIAAHALNDKIADLTGYHLTVVSDDTSEATYEVLIGDTNRAESSSTLQSMQTNGADYMVATTSEKIVIVASTTDNLDAAGETFIGMVTASDGTMTVKKNINK